MADLLPNARVQPLLIFGAGGRYWSTDELPLPVVPSGLSPFVNLGAGVLVPIAGPLSFRAEARFLLTTQGPNSLGGDVVHTDLEVVGGLHLSFGSGGDADGDRIPDGKDGCPDPDDDGDGVLDAADQCPDALEDLDGHVDGDGCPDPDNDGDGVLDGEDLCPMVAGTARGCPDADGDGFADCSDDCPDLPGPVGGCPDTDGDGLLDPDDECPTEAGPVASFGCPDGDGDVITEKVYFDTGRATVKDASLSLLDDVAGILATYDDIERVRVEGHTDSQGSDSSNKELSQARAEAVVEYLVEKGIDGGRLEPVGYGEEQPIADNDSAEGRAENRRVEFLIVDE